jgi:hypothetical protein
VTTADPDPPARTRGRHAKTEPEDDAPPPTAPPQQQPEPQPEPAKAKAKRAWRRHAVSHHPAGSSLVLSAGLVTGLCLAPAVFDQLRFDVATRAAEAARSVAAPWPAGSTPWFWPGWVATVALLAAVAVLALAISGLRIPDAAVTGLAVVLALTTARAAYATLPVVNARLWELLPLCLVCLMAFGFAVGAAVRWRVPEGDERGGGGGEAAAVLGGSWLLVAVVLLAGSAIVSSARTNALGPAGAPQALAGLLSVRAADAEALDDLEPGWVPQVAAAQVTDDDAATAYGTVHRGWSDRFDVLLVRGDDLEAGDVDDTWWLTLVPQSFGSQEEVTAWCGTNGLAGCGPRQVG